MCDSHPWAVPFPGPLQYSPIPVPWACHPSPGKAGTVFVEQRAAQPLATGEERPGPWRPFCLYQPCIKQALSLLVSLGGHWGHRDGLDLKCGLSEQSGRRRNAEADTVLFPSSTVHPTRYPSVSLWPQRLSQPPGQTPSLCQLHFHNGI